MQRLHPESCINRYIIVTLYLKIDNDMAIPIKAVPILSGEIADDFVRRAEEREKNPSKGLSQEQEERVAKVMKQMREFRFPWEKR